MAAKKYTPKDINKNGKLDQWEIKKYEIINKGKPQMGIGEHNALKPKFLKGIFTKDDGSMSTLGNVSNTVGPLAGLVGIGKSIADLIRGGKPAMTDKQKKIASRARKKISKLQDKYEKETGGNELADKNTSNKGKRLAKREEKVRTKAMKKFNKAGDNKPSQVTISANRTKKKKITRPPLNKRKKIRDGSHSRKLLGTKKGAPGTNRRVTRTINGKKKPEFVSDAQRKAVWASKKDGGKGNPNKKKK